METKKLSPYQISGISFLIVIFSALCFGTTTLVFGLVLPPFLPWADIYDAVATYACPSAIAVGVLAFFLARNRQRR